MSAKLKIRLSSKVAASAIAALEYTWSPKTRIAVAMQSMVEVSQQA